MRSRRGRGEGAIFQRRDGVWVGALSVGRDHRGIRRRRVIYGATKAHVLEKLARLRVSAPHGTSGEPERLTLAAFLERWLDSTVRPALRERTYDQYQYIVHRYLVPRLGGMIITRILPGHIHEMLVALEKGGVSPRVRQLIYVVLHRALGQALRWETVPRNVCDAVVRPRVPRKEMRVLSATQVVALLKTARGTRFEALYVLAVTTGLRQGELLGLQWEDIDFAGAKVHIRHGLQQLGDRRWLDEPKTARARRVVNLSAMAVAALRAHRKRMLAEGHPHGYVFCDTRGGSVRKSNLVRRSFKPILQHAELPPIRFHDLRHTAAMLLFTQGVHPRVVQEILGHAQIAMR